MAAIAVGEREEWAEPRRVKPVNRERAPAFSAALTPRGALPERIETQMQRTEAPWSSGLIERNFDAIGGNADIDWPPAPIASEAYDPLPT
jgi:hypothetical protein